MTTSGSGSRSGALVGGVILVALGVLFFVDRQAQFGGGFWKLWPFAMVAIAALKLANARDWPERRGALWLLFVGGWLLVNTLGVFDLIWGTSWPLLVIGIGVLLVLDSLGQRGPSGKGGGDAEPQLR